jgi:hypothetical protein
MSENITPREVELDMQSLGIETDIEKLRESGEDHHHRSKSYGALIEILDQINGSPLGLKFGGDGDNGEYLLYILDMIMEHEDKFTSLLKRIREEASFND